MNTRIDRIIYYQSRLGGFAPSPSLKPIEESSFSGDDDDDDADDADDDVQGALTRRSLVDSDDRPKDPSCLAEVQLDHWWEAEVASLRATRSVMGRSATRSI